MSTVSTEPELTFIEWVARVRCSEHALGGSYSVLIFLGPVPDFPDDWQASPYLVGMHGVYTYSSGGYGSVKEDKAGDEEDDEVEGFVELDDALLRSGVPSLREADVAPYLHDHLDWRIQTVDREVVPVSGLPSLEVAVLSNVLKQGPTDIVPMPVGKPTLHHEVTSHRAGGRVGPAKV